MRRTLSSVLTGMSIAMTLVTGSSTQAEITPSTDPENSRLIVIDAFPDANPTFSPPRTHRVRLYLPADYATSNRRYPVIYLHDGGEVIAAGRGEDAPMDVVYADMVYDRMIQLDLINPAILVAVEPSAIGRSVELTPLMRAPATAPATESATTAPARLRFGRGGGIEDYYSFMAHQLKPYVDSHYRTKPAPADTGVAGMSLGGLASVYMGYNHPETFGIAGCMSPSLWWDKEALVNTIEADRSPRTQTRFWFVVGSDEGDDMWKPTMRAAASLKKRGWVEGKDVALYLDYTGKHTYRTWSAQAPSMFQFMLGKQTPVLNHIAIKQIHDYSGKPIYLSDVKESPYATLELQYDRGYRLNAISPQLTSDNPGVFTVDSENYGRLANRNHGLGLLKASYGGLTAEQVVMGDYPELPPTDVRLPCPAVTTPLDVHAALSTWPELTYSMDLGAARAISQRAAAPAAGEAPASGRSANFGVWQDESYLYVAVQVTKQPLVLDALMPPWGQDGVELRVDAQADPLRTFGKGDGEFEKILLLAASPNPHDAAVPTVHQADKLPPGTLYSCKAADHGYVLQVAIPATYLNAQQKATWNEIRLNLDANTQEVAGGPVAKHWWQPDWRTGKNVPGSGTFRRVGPVPAPARAPAAGKAE